MSHSTDFQNVFGAVQVFPLYLSAILKGNKMSSLLFMSKMLLDFEICLSAYINQGQRDILSKLYYALSFCSNNFIVIILTDYYPKQM
jgi:hypothetical protein